MHQYGWEREWQAPFEPRPPPQLTWWDTEALIVVARGLATGAVRAGKVESDASAAKVVRVMAVCCTHVGALGAARHADVLNLHGQEEQDLKAWSGWWWGARKACKV